MAIHGCKCTAFEGSVYFGSHTKITKIDIVSHFFEAITYGRKATAPLLHWSTMKTHHYLYRYEVLRLKYAMEFIRKKPTKAMLMRYKIEWIVYKVRTMTIAYWKALKSKIKSRII